MRKYVIIKDDEFYAPVSDTWGIDVCLMHRYECEYYVRKLKRKGIKSKAVYYGRVEV